MIRQFFVSSMLFTLAVAGGMPAVAEASPLHASTLQTNAPKPTMEELQKFAMAIQQITPIAQKADQAMASVLEESGLSRDRFREITQAQRNPEAKPEKPITAEEKSTYDSAVAKMVEIQKNARTQMSSVIEAQGLQPARFSQIFQVVRRDPELRKQVQQMIRQ